MYNSNTFWIIAIICFIAFSIIYFIFDKAFTFRVILDICLVFASFIGLYLSNKKSKNNKKYKM